jgi:hypothetical protein
MSMVKEESAKDSMAEGGIAEAILIAADRPEPESPRSHNLHTNCSRKNE